MVVEGACCGKWKVYLPALGIAACVETAAVTVPVVEGADFEVHVSANWEQTGAFPATDVHSVTSSF